MLNNFLYESCKIERVENAVAAGTTDQTSDTVDMSGFHGCMFIATLGTLTASQVTTGKVTTSSDNSTFNDVEGSQTTALDDADDNLMIVIDIYRPLERYLRFVLERGTANAVIDGVIAIQYDPISVATTASTDVAESLTLLSPDEGTA